MPTSFTQTASGVVYGVVPLTGFIVKNNSISSKNANASTVADENGNVIDRRYDDLTKDLSIDMTFNGGAAPVPGNTLLYDGILYILETVDVKSENKGYRTFALKGITSQYITLS